MDIVNIHEAKTHLSRLLERVARGESIVIAKAGKPIARLVAYCEERAPRSGGAMEGTRSYPGRLRCAVATGGPCRVPWRGTVSGFLLDTHVILWWLDDPSLLSVEARGAIRDPEHRVLISTAAIWEIGIKKSLGRLDIPANLAEVLQRDSIDVLDIQIDHALSVAELPMLHQDPFDRMQVVQANLEGLTLITRDSRIQQYEVRWLGA